MWGNFMSKFSNIRAQIWTQRQWNNIDCVTRCTVNVGDSPIFWVGTLICRGGGRLYFISASRYRCLQIASFWVNTTRSSGRKIKQLAPLLTGPKSQLVLYPNRETVSHIIAYHYFSLFIAPNEETPYEQLLHFWSQQGISFGSIFLLFSD